MNPSSRDRGPAAAAASSGAPPVEGWVAPRALVQRAAGLVTDVAPAATRGLAGARAAAGTAVRVAAAGSRAAGAARRAARRAAGTHGGGHGRRSTPRATGRSVPLPRPTSPASVATTSDAARFTVPDLLHRLQSEQSTPSPADVRETALVPETTIDVPVAAAHHERRRPLLVAGGVAVLLGAGLVVAGVTAAHAGSAAPPAGSVSVARQLGVTAAATDVPGRAVEQELGELAASRAQREAERSSAAQAQQEADRSALRAAAEAARPKAVLPVPGGQLTSTFGPRWGVLHPGIDLAAPMGTPEYAAADGLVVRAGPASGFGLAVYIRHDNGDVTVYGHMEKVLVQPGQAVKAGDTIALLGNEGESTGPHLHFEVHAGAAEGPATDPLPWLRARGLQL